MSNWMGFLALAPERVVDLIEDGPKPLVEYGTHGNLRRTDKKMGVMRFKGGEGRGGVSTKAGQQGVAYFDPSFAAPCYDVMGDVPDDVLKRHSYEEYRAVFEKL